MWPIPAERDGVNPLTHSHTHTLTHSVTHHSLTPGKLAADLGPAQLAGIKATVLRPHRSRHYKSMLLASHPSRTHREEGHQVFSCHMFSSALPFIHCPSQLFYIVVSLGQQSLSTRQYVLNNSKTSSTVWFCAVGGQNRHLCVCVFVSQFLCRLHSI